MAESFLEEQLKRIKEMTEQMSRVRMFHETWDVHNRSSETPAMAHDRKPRDPARPTRRLSSRHPTRGRGR